MDAQQFLAEFGHIANAPNGVVRLRELILALAVQGRLVEQLESAEPAEVQLEKIRRIASGLPITGRRKKANALAANSFLPTIEGTLPKGWANAPLCELVRVLNGRAYSKPELLDSGTPVLRVGNLFTSDKWYYSNIELEDDKYCDNGDLLYAWSASFGPFIWGGEKVIYHYHIWKLDLFSNLELNKNYLYTYLLEKTQEIKAAGHGISMAHMTKEKFEQLSILLPPLEEQSRIVAKVDELMALCDKLEAQQQERRKLQNNLRQSTLQAVANANSPHELQTAWTRLVENFGQLFHLAEDLIDLNQCIKHLALKGLLTVPVPGETIPPSITDLTITSSAVTETEMDWQIPIHWVWARCAWLGDARLGKMLDAAKNKGELRPYLRNVNVRWGKFDLTDVLKMRVEEHELPRISVRKGDLVICEGGEPGRAAIWEGEDEFVIQKALHRFRCNEALLPEYFLFCLEHDYWSGRLSRYYTGATIKHLTGRSLGEYSIPLPPVEEQMRILSAVNCLTDTVANLEANLIVSTRTAEAFTIAAVSSLSSNNSALGAG